MSGLRNPLLIKCWYCFVAMIVLYRLPTLDSVKLDDNRSSTSIQASSNTTALHTLRPSLFLALIPSLPPTIVSTKFPPTVLSLSLSSSSPTSSPPSLSHKYNFKDLSLSLSLSSSPPSLSHKYNFKDVSLSLSSSSSLSLSLSLLLSSTVSRGPTSSPTVTFLPIEGSTCSDTCGSERELVDNNHIKDKILQYIDEGKMKKIHCLDTSKITNMKYLLNTNNGDNDTYYGGDDTYYGGNDAYYGGDDTYYGGDDTYYGGKFESFNTDINCWDVSSVTSMFVSNIILYNYLYYLSIFVNL